MSSAKIYVYATEWCGACKRTRSFLQNHQVDFEWVNIDRDKEGERFVLQVNQGMRSVPTILFPDGSTLTEPSIILLARKLDIPLM